MAAGAGESDPTFLQRKWETENSFREREIQIKEQELALKRTELARSGWRNPLVVAIIAAAIAAAGNATVAVINGSQQRDLERQRAEEARILEMLKTGDPDKAAENLDFLLQAGLIADGDVKKRLTDFLENREPGTGPALASTNPISPSIIGADDAIAVDQLQPNDALIAKSRSVGLVKVPGSGTVGNNSAFGPACTAFLVGDDLVLTARFCVEHAAEARLELNDGTGASETFRLTLPPIEADSALNYALLKVDGHPGKKYGTLVLADRAPLLDEELSFVMFRAEEKLVISGTKECRVVEVAKNDAQHSCDSGAGTSGGPLMSADGQVIGIHTGRGSIGGIAIRSDVILKASGTL